VRNGPTEIDFDLDDLLTANRENFRIAKPLSIRGSGDVCDEYLLVVGYHMDKVKPGNRPTVRPAANEVGRSIKAVVERAGEVEVLGYQGFYRCAIFVGISLIASACNGSRIGSHPFFDCVSTTRHLL